MEASSDDDDDEVLATLSAIAASAQHCMDGSSTSSSEEDDLWGGSRVGKSQNFARDFENAYTNLLSHYFNGEQSVYSEDHFERRFGVPREVFEKVKEHIMGESFFVQREDCTGKKGIHPVIEVFNPLVSTSDTIMGSRAKSSASNCYFSRSPTFAHLVNCCVAAG